jgi:tRNA(Ile)-lysidine synthase
LETLRKRFFDFVQHEQLYLPEHRILVAISGGLDSTVLAHLLFHAGQSIGLAHANFGLREEEADKDEAFVKALAEEWGVPFFSKRFETKKYATLHGLSTQMAARQLRYEWFEHLLPQGFDKVATAHHLNDSLETTLLHLTRGTGLAGLTGIPLQNGPYIRPLLFATRAELYQEAITQGIPWREDASNATSEYHRNLIRLEVIPLLEKINPGLLRTFANTLQRLNETRLWVDDSLHQLLNQHRTFQDNHEVLNLTHLTQHPALPVLLTYWLEKTGFTRSQIIDCLRVVKHQGSGKVFFSTDKTFQLLVDRNRLILSSIPPKRVEATEFYLNEPRGACTIGKYKYRWEVVAADTPLSKDSDIAMLAFETLAFPLLLRPWQKGDNFYPLGMKGKKKLSDFMIDAKIDLNLKKEVMVLESAGNIAWVVGHRIDDRFKWTSSSQQIFKISRTHV